MSWADACDSALEAAKVNGCDSWYIGYNLDMARQYINDVAMWARAFNLACSGIQKTTLGQIQETVLDDPDKDILAFTVYFSSGFKVSALSSRPANLRSKKGRIRIDEAAFHQDLDELLKAAIAILMWGGKVAVWSTHNGKKHYFNQLIEQCKKGEKKYSIHKYDLKTAIDDGLYKRICLRDNRIWTPEDEIEWENQLRSDYGLFASEELDCIPFEGKGGGSVVKREWFEIVDSVPAGGRMVRFWDLAASVKSSSFYTAGVRMKQVDGVYYILHWIAERVGPAEGNDLILQTARIDGINTKVRWELEGGSAGIYNEDNLKKILKGFNAEGVKPMGDKLLRARPFASDAMKGKVKILRGDWNERYLDSIYEFDGTSVPLITDTMDATSGAHSQVKIAHAKSLFS